LSVRGLIELGRLKYMMLGH